MKILITGISGLLGNALSQELSKNHQVFGIYYKDRDLIAENRFVKSFECDISDKKQLFKKIKDLNLKPEAVIHTAAITDVNFCELNQERCWKVNVIGTRDIAEIAKFFGTRFIYISTASVFSGERGNYKEDDVPHPQNFYNLTKLLGEEIALSLGKNLVLRTNLIGIHPKRTVPANFLEWLVEKIRANQDFTLFKDVNINPVSNFTLAEIISQILGKETKEKIFHVGSKNVLSKAEIGKIVIRKFSNFKGKVKISSVDEMSFSAKRPKEMWLCSKFIENKLGIKMPSLEEEIKKIFKQNEKKV